MSRFYKLLNVPVEAFKMDELKLVLPQLQSIVNAQSGKLDTKFNAAFTGEHVLTDEFIAWYSAKGLELKTILMLVHTPEFREANLHIDSVVGENVFNPVMNYVFADGEQDLSFYTNPHSLNDFAYKITVSNNIRYFKVDHKDVQFAEMTEDLGPFLLDGSVPHQAHMRSGTLRHCVSIRFKGLKTFEEIKEIFKDEIIESR